MQYIHYIIIISIILLIVIIQLHFFENTRQKIRNYARIFPGSSNEYKLQKEFIEQIKLVDDSAFQLMFQEAGLEWGKYYYIEKAEGAAVERWKHNRVEAEAELIEHLSNTGKRISVSHNNSTFNTIVNSINDYLQNNKTVSDFHLMKDIVDRNCDAQEEEITTQIPVPLYMGLIGTMAGILVGILYLWSSGGISDLLNAGEGSGADGVEALLGGVALAMISSILGIILTTWGSNGLKSAKSQVEKSKHLFLSWIQTKLLPTLSDNIVGAIHEMTLNLENFNDEFAKNTGSLGTALEKVNETYKMQVHLLDAVGKIADKDITRQNLNLYNALQNSSAEIGTLAEYLKDCNQYLSNVRALNEKLDLQENRTRMIEQVGVFFQSELKQIDSRKEAIAQSVGKVDDYLQQAITKLKDSAEEQFSLLKNSTGKQQEAFASTFEMLSDSLNEILKRQNDALINHFTEVSKNMEIAVNEQLEMFQQKKQEINVIADELRKMGEVKDAILGFESAIIGQNNKIDRLTDNIEKLANVKTNRRIIQMRQKTSIWQIALMGIIALSCVALSVKSFMTSVPDKKNVEEIQFPSVSQDEDALLNEDVVVDTVSVVVNKQD